MALKPVVSRIDWAVATEVAMRVRQGWRPDFGVRERSRGLCYGTDNPYIFFPNQGDNAATEKARTQCRGCPVVRECAAHAFITHESHGVWGATTPGMRTKILESIYPKGNT